MNLLGRGAVLASFAVSVFVLDGCAASKRGADPASPAAQGSSETSAEPTSTGAPPPAPSPATKTPPGAGGYAQPPPTPMGQAGMDMDSAQRELDVAAGDCRNACRALGSMDRAAGRLCTLARSGDDGRRCDDAKKRVYSARDKVKATCGTCDDVTVDRNAPIPSR